MSISDYAIQKKTISWMFAAILAFGGVTGFLKLGQLEFPEFTIKSALVVTQYPGASPMQVEEEVTLRIENAIQQLPYIDNITSINGPGVSQITVEIRSSYTRNELPQIWDELRRKVKDVRAELPPGSEEPQVFDDFGDVFGLLYVATGEGYSNSDIAEYLDLLRRELVLISGVGKVEVSGEIPEQVFVNVSKQKLHSLQISPQEVFGVIQNQNVVSNAGAMFNGHQSIRLHPTGEYAQPGNLNDLIVRDDGNAIVYLGDVATVTEGYAETPRHIYRSNGEPAMALGISFTTGVNVVEIVDAVERKLAQLEGSRPVGMTLTPVYNQGEVVEKSISSFIVSLAQAVAIVIAVLFLTMGLRAGLLMGVVLLLTISGTFVVMYMYDIQLQKISLGALIIALGMLVDNGIVVTEGILVGTSRGLSKLKAARQIVRNTAWPLLGATIIAIVAFAPIGFSPDDTGEFANSLFWVLFISLILSWLTAVTLTPFFFDLLFTERDSSDDNPSEPYSNRFYAAYLNVLQACLHRRILTLAIVTVAFGCAIFGFGSVKNVFFPPSTTPMFFIDYWMPQGTDIRETSREIALLEEDVSQFDSVSQVTTVVGQGATRFILTYEPERSYANYAQLIVRTETLDDVDPVIERTLELLRTDYPHAQYVIKNLDNGPAPKAKLELRISGPDPDVLRKLAASAMEIMKRDSNIDSVRHDWRERTLVVRPEFLEAQAREVGVDRNAVNDALLVNFSGKPVGTFRREDDLLPIIARAEERDRLSPSSLSDTEVWSAKARSYVPITQVVDGFDTQWEDSLIMRKDRRRTISVMAEPRQLTNVTADSVLKSIRDDIESIELPAGYEMEWGGEYEMSKDAQAGLFTALPLGLLAMFLITVFLFDSVKQALVIWTSVPLSLIGIAGGLLLLDAPFSFMALLGMLSLSGMLIKNGVVLLEEIKREEQDRADPYQALCVACVSRLRPVSMAALTTVLGMIPLLFDAFFYSMAVTIIFGLAFATLLTLVVLPVVYAAFTKLQGSRGSTAELAL